MMNINGIATQYQNYAGVGTSKTKSSPGENKTDTFQNAIVNWKNQIKEKLAKEQENDANGNIMMSEKKWRDLMKKVDNVIDNIEDSNNAQEKEETKLMNSK